MCVVISVPGCPPGALYGPSWGDVGRMRVGGWVVPSGTSAAMESSLSVSKCRVLDHWNLRICTVMLVPGGPLGSKRRALWPAHVEMAWYPSLLCHWFCVTREEYPGVPKAD
jgi:hypothetical protein